MLHPSRKPMTGAPPLPAETVEITGDGVVLKGWLFRATGDRRGTIVYLHGSADNRASVVGVAKRYVPRGYDVLAYDSRAHGDSTGDACTYGYYEKRDLAKAIDSLKVPVVAVIGVSLGAAVAIQAAAEGRGAHNIRVFGSVARGDQRYDSDVDFLVDQDVRQVDGGVGGGPGPPVSYIPGIPGW